MINSIEVTKPVITKESTSIHLMDKFLPKKATDIFLTLIFTIFSSYCKIPLHPSTMTSLLPFISKCTLPNADAIGEQEKFNICLALLFIPLFLHLFSLNLSSPPLKHLKYSPRKYQMIFIFYLIIHNFKLLISKHYLIN